MRCAALLFVLAATLPAAGRAHEPPDYVVTPLAERRIARLPPGPLYWRVETLASQAAAAAAAAAGQTSLAVEADGRHWLLTLAAPGGATPGATRLAEIGPVPAFTARAYLLRVNRAGGPPGARTSLHSHPGSESFYVLRGRLGQTLPDGERQVAAGHALAGRQPGLAMQVSSSGETDLEALVMFVVDADRPFSTDTKIR